MNDSTRAGRPIVALVALLLYALACLATLALWFALVPEPRGWVAASALGFALLIQSGYLALFLAGFVSARLGHVLSAASRVIAGVAWTGYALVGALTLVVFASLAAAGVEAPGKLFALLFAELVVALIPSGLIAALEAQLRLADADLERLRGPARERALALQRLGLRLRALAGEPALAVRVERLGKGLDALRARLAHAPASEVGAALAQPHVDELARWSTRELPSERAAFESALSSIEGTCQQARAEACA